MAMRRILLLPIVVLTCLLLFVFFMPVIPVNNSQYAPDVDCPPLHICDSGVYMIYGHYHLFASTAYFYFGTGAVVYNGTYTLSHEEVEVVPFPCPSTVVTCETGTGTIAPY